MFVFHKMKLLWSAEDEFAHIRWAPIDGTKYLPMGALTPAKERKLETDGDLFPTGP